MIKIQKFAQKHNLLNQICNSTNHNFMKNSSGAVIHLVKLINAADTIVTQHKCTTVEIEQVVERSEKL